MASKRTRSGSKSLNKEEDRQPFSDISNFNLIPTSTLQKLCNPSSSFASSSAANSLISKPQNVVRKPSISGSKSDSNTSKPYHNNSAEFTSDTSDGSSNFSSVQKIQNPNAVVDSSVSGRASLPGSSSATPIGRDDEAVAHSQRNTTKKSNLEATVLPLTPSLNEKENRKGNAIAEPFSSLPPTTTKDKGKAIAKPLSSLSLEIKKDKGKGVAGKSVLVSGHEKKKGSREPFTSPSPGKAKGKGKPVSHESFPSDETAAEEKFGALSRKCSPLEKRRRKGRVDASAFSCPTLPKTRSNRTDFNGPGDIRPLGSQTDYNQKRKKKRCTEHKDALKDSLPQDFVDYWREHYKKVDEFELPEEEVSYSDLE